MYLLPEYALSHRINTIFHADALSLLRALPDASVALIASDPPYGIGYASSRTTRSDGSPRVTRNSFGADVIQLDWIPEAARVLKPDGAMYLFTRWDVLHIWKQALENAGLSVVQRIIWDKLHWGMGDLNYFGSQVEDILFCVKTAHELKWDKRGGNLFRACNGKPMAGEDGYFDNPTQKPERLLRKIITLSSNPGDVICDPFAGSGTTAKAARDLGRSFIAGDIDAYQVGIARQRLAQPYTLPMFETLPLFAAVGE